MPVVLPLLLLLLRLFLLLLLLLPPLSVKLPFLLDCLSVW